MNQLAIAVFEHGLYNQSMSFFNSYVEKLRSAVNYANRSANHDDSVHFSSLHIEDTLANLRPARDYLARKLDRPAVELWPEESQDELIEALDTLEKALKDITIREGYMLTIAFGRDFDYLISKLKGARAQGIRISLKDLTNSYFETYDELYFLETQERSRKALEFFKKAIILQPDNFASEDVIKEFLQTLAEWEDLIEKLYIYDEFFMD